MIQIENIEVWGFEHAIRGMRNPMNSWSKSDSGYGIDGEDETTFVIGENDLDLMHRLYKAGSEHRKYLRQIQCSFDCIAPLYWYKEFDTYKVGTTANSCSTMHKIHAKEFTLDDFSIDHLEGEWFGGMYEIVRLLNEARGEFLETKDKDYWWQMIQLLPSSYNQRRTITMNYENVMAIINQREGHKLDEWGKMTETLRNLPYIKEIRGD